MDLSHFKVTTRIPAVLTQGVSNDLVGWVEGRNPTKQYEKLLLYLTCQLCAIAFLLFAIYTISYFMLVINYSRISIEKIVMINWIDYVVPISVSITAISIVVGGLLWAVNLMINSELKSFEAKYTKDFSDFKNEYIKAFSDLELRLTKLLAEKD